MYPSLSKSLFFHFVHIFHAYLSYFKRKGKTLYNKNNIIGEKYGLKFTDDIPNNDEFRSFSVI